MEHFDLMQKILIPVAHAAENVAEHADEATHVAGTTSGIVHASTEVPETLPGDVIGRLGLDGKLFVAQVINFALVLFVLWKFVYTPLLKLMDERTKKIEAGLQKADEIDKRVEELEAEKEVVLAAARKEAQDVIDSANASAEEKRQSMIIKAKSEVEKVVSHGKAQLAAQKADMIREAKGELADMIVNAASKVVDGNIDKAGASESARLAVESLSKDL